MTTPETALGEFVASLSYDDLPEGSTETLTRAFVDTVGVTLAGTVEGAGRTVAKSAGRRPTEAAPAELLGVNTDETPASVALRVGTAGHALDYDDLSWAMDGHPSVTLVPSLLALATETDASGRDLLTAYAAGFETECAVAAPISPSHYEDGWHATATFGTFGATAAAAKLLGLDAQATRRALCIAASMPAGLKRNFGSMTKPLHAGLCSRAGVTAAQLARDGLTADAQAISGEKGFWALYGPAERAAFSIGDRWALQEEGIHVKAYPCCYFTHTSIAATQAIVADDIDPTDIERITVAAAPGAGDALHHANPGTGLEAKFSMEYCVASAAVRDRVGVAAFQDEAVDDTAVQSIRERVAFTVDDTLDYDSHEAVVRVETGADSVVVRQENPPGVHTDPLSEPEFRAKFTECAGSVLDDDAVNGLYESLSSLAAISDLQAALRVGAR
jgi:2-methylcitrate dehydratase PrpD